MDGGCQIEKRSRFDVSLQLNQGARQLGEGSCLQVLMVGSGIHSTLQDSHRLEWPTRPPTNGAQRHQGVRQEGTTHSLLQFNGTSSDLFGLRETALVGEEPRSATRQLRLSGGIDESCHLRDDRGSFGPTAQHSQDVLQMAEKGVPLRVRPAGVGGRLPGFLEVAGRRGEGAEADGAETGLEQVLGGPVGVSRLQEVMADLLYLIGIHSYEALGDRHM
jgi:hypothetical protein